MQGSYVPQNVTLQAAAQPTYVQHVPQVVQQAPQVVQQAPAQTIVFTDDAPGAPSVANPIVVEAPGAPTTVVAPTVRHLRLAKCRALYLGSAVPTETSVGLEAIQQPLRERYPLNSDEMNGIDVWITVFSSGIQMRYVDDSSAVSWFPIQNLHVCAAVKAIEVVYADGEKQVKFVAIDSENGCKSVRPPIFSTIIRRCHGIKVLECHSFICKTNQAAMALVQSCTHAYEHKEGWLEDGQAPPEELARSADPVRLLAAGPQPKGEKVGPEYYKQPPQEGYFYTTNKGLVKSYNVSGGPEPEPVACVQPCVQPLPPCDPAAETYGLVPAVPQPYPGVPQPYPAEGALVPQPYPAEGALVPQDPYAGYYGNYFSDWAAFPGQPVAYLGLAPPAMAPPRKKKGKKKKKAKKPDCACDEVDEWYDDYDCREYYPSDYYKEYRKKRRDERRDERRDDRRRRDYGPRDPPRDRDYPPRDREYRDGYRDALRDFSRGDDYRGRDAVYLDRGGYAADPGYYYDFYDPDLVLNSNIPRQDYGFGFGFGGGGGYGNAYGDQFYGGDPYDYSKREYLRERADLAQRLRDTRIY